MKPLFVYYPRCSTCRKAARWLAEQGVEVAARDIVADRPAEDELRKWIGASGLPVRKFFNTSGLLYKELGLKGKLEGMSEAEMIALLAADGKMVRRPVLVLPDRVLVGFKEEVWQEALGRSEGPRR